jgi:hypothetical protein
MDGFACGQEASGKRGLEINMNRSSNRSLGWDYLPDPMQYSRLALVEIRLRRLSCSKRSEPLERLGRFEPLCNQCIALQDTSRNDPLFVTVCL